MTREQISFMTVEISREDVSSRDSEQSFRAMIDALPAAIYTTDAEGRITRLNPACIDLFGGSPTISSDDWCRWELFHPDGRPMPHDDSPMAIALKERRVIRGAELMAERADGTSIWLTIQAAPLLEDSGELVGGINMLVDITERKAAEARIQSDADAMKRLTELSSRLWAMRTLRGGLDEMLAATMELLRADFGNIQILDVQRGVLLIEAQRGFQNEFLEFFREVSADDGSACGRALRTGERIIVEDVEKDLDFAPLLHIAHNAGFAAVASTPIIDRDGRALGMISTHFHSVHRPTEKELHLLDLYARQAADFIEHKRADIALRESEERLRLLADNMAQLAWICDNSGNVTWYNQRWLQYTGMSSEEMKECGCTNCHHPDHVDRIVTGFTRARENGETWEDTFPLRAHDGTYRWFLAHALPIRDVNGQITCWFGTNTDIEDLKHAREAAETANRIKDDFLATASHELRTPLNAIMGWTHVLTAGNVDEETLTRGLEAIGRNASAQKQLISDLLDVSRIISGHLRFDNGVVDLRSVIAAATETMRPGADCAGIFLQLELDQDVGLVAGDAMRLQQIVWNLLSNAIKFTPAGGQVTVRLKREGTNVVLSVIDTGEGITAEFLPYVFDRFRQAESEAKRQRSGLGLGLAIVRHLVEAHGGTIRASSKGVGQGATFTVTFPLLAWNGNRLAFHPSFC